MYPRIAVVVVATIFASACLSKDENWGIHGSTTIAEGEFFVTGFTAKERPAALYFSFNLSGGPPVDFYTMDDANFANYDAGRPFTYAQACSRTNVTMADDGCIVQAGSWLLVIDNTDLGIARPTGPGNATAVLSYDFRTEPQ